MKTLLSLFALFPSVVNAVKTANEHIPAGNDNAGSNKKEMILAIIIAATKVGENIPIPVVQGISLLIDSIVAILNKTGVFGTTTTLTNLSTEVPNVTVHTR